MINFDKNVLSCEKLMISGGVQNEISDKDKLIFA